MSTTPAPRLVADLRELAPPPQSGALDPETRERLEIEVLSGIGRAQRAERSLLRRAHPGALVAACLVAVATLVALALTTSPGDAPTALPVRADADAVRALDGLATVALTASGPAVRPDQFAYVRSTVISNEGGFEGPVQLDAPHEREIWLSQETSTAEPGLIREFGQDWPINSVGAAPAGPDRPTYPWIASLPDDPDLILTELRSHQLPGAPQSSDQYAFERIGDLLAEGVVPPELAGALFRAVTKIPGVRFDERAEDAIGRAGFGISRTDESFGVTTTWVFRPGSPEILGTRWYLPATSPGGPDVLFGATAILERGVVDELGVRPADRARA